MYSQKHKALTCSALLTVLVVGCAVPDTTWEVSQYRDLDRKQYLDSVIPPAVNYITSWSNDTNSKNETTAQPVNRIQVPAIKIQHRNFWEDSTTTKHK